MDSEAIIKNLKSVNKTLYDLDPEKSFSRYVGIRELAFCIIEQFISNKSELQDLIYETCTFLEDIMLIDKAITNNIYHYINIRFDGTIPEDRKNYLQKNIDHYMRPRENKQNPPAHRFGAGCLTYLLSYKNNLTSKDEARAFTGYIFKLSDTEVRNCAQIFETAYKNHILSERTTSPIKKHSINMFLFMIISDLLDERQENFDSLFNQYQTNSIKKAMTTQKTYSAYKSEMNSIFNEINQKTNFQRFPNMGVDNKDIFNDWESLVNISSETINEEQLFKLHAFIDIDNFTTQ